MSIVIRFSYIIAFETDHQDIERVNQLPTSILDISGQKNKTRSRLIYHCKIRAQP